MTIQWSASHYRDITNQTLTENGSFFSQIPLISWHYNGRKDSRGYAMAVTADHLTTQGAKALAATTLLDLGLRTSKDHNKSWWRHQMETISAPLAICAGNSPVPGEFHAPKPVTRSFDIFFDLRLNNDWVNNREAGDWDAIVPIMTSL